MIEHLRIWQLGMRDLGTCGFGFCELWGSGIWGFGDSEIRVLESRDLECRDLVDYMRNLNRCPANPQRSNACDALAKQASTNKTCKIHRHCTVPAPMSGAVHLFFPPVSPSPVSPCHVLYCPGPFHAARNSDTCSSTNNSKRTCLPPEQRSANTCNYIHPLINIYISNGCSAVQIHCTITLILLVASSPERLKRKV